MSMMHYLFFFIDCLDTVKNAGRADDTLLNFIIIYCGALWENVNRSSMLEDVLSGLPR